MAALVGVSRPPASSYFVSVNGGGLWAPDESCDAARKGMILLDMRESWRDRLRLLLPWKFGAENSSVDRWRELDAEGVLGGWKKCDLAPTLMSSLEGRATSKLKEPGIATCTEGFVMTDRGNVRDPEA